MAWGLNDHLQCTVPSPNSGFVAVAGGGYPGFSLGLKSDGSIVAWGDTPDGQCDVPEPNGGFVAIAAGGMHSLGLRASLVGACCHNDDVCAYAVQEDCLTPSVWIGVGSLCVPNPCPPVGACCVGPCLDECVVVTAAECPSALWLGPGTTCAGSCVIPPDIVACCFPDGSCLEVGSNECCHAGGWIDSGPTCEPNPCVSAVGEQSGNSLGTRVWAAPNPAAGRVVIQYELSVPGASTLLVFDASGPLVRHLADGPRSAGRHTVVWDGFDDAGRETPAGIYLLRRVQRGGRWGGW